jgi:hypothetical protein
MLINKNINIMDSIIGKYNFIKEITSKKSNITNYKSLTALLELFKVKYSEDNNGNFIINLEIKTLSQREMDAITAGLYMFCKSFSVNISTI